ncbi:hypothetical protein L7F22_043988 [Adiantum nelumboides]|nr:hypothetical protein [Adiantum nelumboides]
MSFSQRNLYYLRASRNVVMQAVLYLDPKNLRWMNAPLYVFDDDEMDFEEDITEDGKRRTRTIGDEIIKKALDHLSKVLMAKLYKEKREDGSLSSSTAGTRKVDQYIDVDFMMAYFFRQVDKKHAILLKKKDLKFPQKREPMAPPMISASKMRKNQTDQPTILPPSRLAERQANETDRHDIVAEGQDIGSRTDDIRVKEEDDAFDTNFSFTEQETVENVEIEEEPANDTAIDLDAIEDDKKPRISVSYTGFRIFELTLILVIEPTKKIKRLRPELFREEVQTEKHLLSATPLPDQHRQTPLPPSQPTRNSRSLSVASSFDGDDADDNDDQQTAQQRADSRRLASVNRQSSGGPLFRGTPSDWEPTPTPTPAPEDRGTQTNTSMDDEDNDSETEERPEESAGFALATQLLNADGAENGGRGYEDDDE